MQNLHDWVKKFRKPAEPPARSEHEQLIEDLREVRLAMESLDSVFAMESDEDLVDAAIYQREALESRYRYLLRLARETNAVAAEVPLTADNRERWIN